MNTTKTLLAAALCASSMLCTVARADTYAFNYSDGVLTASGSFTELGGDVVSITGMVGTDAITGLLGYAGPAHISPGGAFSYDNRTYGGGTLSNGGILFSVAGDAPGQEWNLWSDGGASASLWSWAPDSGYKVASSSTMTIAFVPVPEPETYALMLAGLGAVGMLARRRRPV